MLQLSHCVARVKIIRIRSGINLHGTAFTFTFTFTFAAKANLQWPVEEFRYPRNWSLALINYLHESVQFTALP